MGIFNSFLQQLPLLLLSIPVVLMALSVHESAHGYAAYKLGDPTARNLGRITLNPVKHFDIFGFLALLVFHIGWAKPVPIASRNFKNPRRDFAIVGAAGPISNICLALIHLLILRGVMFGVTSAFTRDALPTGVWLAVLSMVVYILYLGVAINVLMAIFNLIPIPPFDGSRIFYAFLPPKWYFGIMRYERYIMFGFIIVFFALSRFGFNPLSALEGWITNGLFTITGMGSGTVELGLFNDLIKYLRSLVYAA